MKTLNNWRWYASAASIVASYTLIKPLKIDCFVGASNTSTIPLVSSLATALVIAMSLCFSVWFAASNLSRRITWIMNSYIILCSASFAATWLQVPGAHWIWYCIAEAHTACTLALFWQRAYICHSMRSAAVYYPRYMISGALGSLGAPALLTLIVMLIPGCSKTLVAGVLAITLLVVATWALQTIPTSEFARQQRNSTAHVMPDRWYIGGIIAMSLGYELIKTLLEIQTTTALVQLNYPLFTSWLWQTALSQTFIIVCLVLTSGIHAYVPSLRARLLITPLALFATIVSWVCIGSPIILIAGYSLIQICYEGIGYATHKILLQPLPRVARIRVSLATTNGKRATKLLGNVLHLGAAGLPLGLHSPIAGALLLAGTILLAAHYLAKQHSRYSQE